MPDTPRLRMLVVDDQTTFRAAVRRLVSHAGDLGLVGEATSIVEAVRVARELQPDLLLMDINLPDGSGIGATAQVLAVSPATVVILVSTYRSADLPPDAAGSGARAYLHKEHVTAPTLRGIFTGDEPRATFLR